MEHRDIIRLWPTVPELAEQIQVQPARVYKWGDRNSIPPEFWRRLIDAGEGAGISLTVDDFLDGLEAAA